MPKKIKQCAIGIDIGGTNMKSVLIYDNEVIADYSLATPKDNLEHFFIMLKALVEPLFAQAREKKLKIAGLGIGVPGIIKEGKIIKAPNIEIINSIDLAEKARELFDLPIKIDNDANCFLRAEIKMGAVKNMDNVFGMIIGTGLGGAWWFNGQIYAGARQSAGEPGHMIVDCAGDEENRDKVLDLEVIYQKLTKNNPANLATEAYQGDALAKQTYEEIGKYLGLGLVNVINLLDPEAVVLGGGVIDSNELFLKKIKEVIKEGAINPEAKKIKIYISKLGKEAGAIGAALLI